MNEKDFEAFMEPVRIFDATTHTNSEWDDDIYATWGHVPVEVRRLASIVTAWPEKAADAVRMASGSGFYWRGGYFINDENAQVADKAQWERARELYLAKDEKKSIELYATWDDVPEDLQWLAENVNDQIWIDRYLSGEKRGQQPFLSADESHYKFTREQWQRARDLYLAKESSRPARVCKGENCTRTSDNNNDHSPECIAEHERSYMGLPDPVEQQSAEWVDGMRPEILQLAKLMQEKLDNNKHKDGGARKGWICDMQFLLSKLQEEVSELFMAVYEKQEPHRLHREAADVANLAMMIADNYSPLIPAEEQQAADERGQFIQKAAKVMFDVSGGVIDDNSLGALFDEGCRLKDKD